MDIRVPKKRPTKPNSRTEQASAKTKKTQTKSRFVFSSNNRRKNQSTKKALVRHAIVVVNLIIVGLAAYVVISNPNGDISSFGSAKEDKVNPLDRVSAADIAVNAARMAGVQEAPAVMNYADTINAEMENYAIGGELAYAPQIMSANIKTLADIEDYVTKLGDNVSELATRFGVTSDSIKWSNDLLNDTLEPGIKLQIPPMNGIIYTVQAGDTPEKLAGIYRVPVSQLIAFNDAEVTGLVPGQRIFMPNAQKPVPVFSFYARYGNNGYDAGYCTYYAATKAGAPAGWGHARTWARYAAQTPGWVVDRVPVKGSIAQTDRISIWGHVAIVEDVKQENGIYYIKYSDMNGVAGYNRVGHSDWTDATMFQNYIYRVQ